MKKSEKKIQKWLDTLYQLRKELSYTKNPTSEIEEAYFQIGMAIDRLLDLLHKCRVGRS